MGEKRISVRTLPDGTKVRHHPPDERHPDGKMVLVRQGPNGLQQHFREHEEEHRAAIEEMRQQHLAAVNRLRDLHEKGGLPPSKRSI